MHVDTIVALVGAFDFEDTRVSYNFWHCWKEAFQHSFPAAHFVVIHRFYQPLDADNPDYVAKAHKQCGKHTLLFGHSMGGITARKVAQSNDNVAGIITFGTPHKWGTFFGLTPDRVPVVSVGGLQDWIIHPFLTTIPGHHCFTEDIAHLSTDIDKARGIVERSVSLLEGGSRLPSCFVATYALYTFRYGSYDSP